MDRRALFNKMTVIMVSLVCFGFTSCNNDEGNEGGETNILGVCSVKVTIDENFIGNKVSTPMDETSISSSKIEVRSNVNDKVQTFVVNDGENVFLIARTPVDGHSQVVIDTQSTTLAMVTMYPLFSAIDVDGYKDIISLITSSDKYPALYDEVSKVITERKNLYDLENVDLLKAFSNLIEDLCNYVEEEAFGDTLAIIENQNLASTRATYESARLDPTYIDADITGSRLTLRTVGLTPTYFGTVTYSGGETTNLAIKSRADFGGLDLFTKTVGNWRYGAPMTYNFNNEGEYYFEFSRTTPEATADFFLRLANCLLTSLGLDLGNDAIQEIGNSISRAMINAGTGVNDQVIDPMEWVGIAYNATLEQLRTGSFFGHGISESFIFGAEFLSRSLNWYNKIKGIGNAATRLAFAITAPETFSFCLCNYKNHVTTCSEANIEKVSGDNQTGYAKQKLLDPLRVSVKTIDENGMYVESSNYHRVKYEVTKGGGKVASDLVTVGNDNTASVEWTLGESGEQEVRAVVIDMITEKEISEAVYFTASLEKAEVTVRLDWSQHSGNTDIDLHVIDPFGERIYFENMESESGGYLDRDDTHGPGPEHIHWDSAPAGTYKIYVHYYPNEDEDKSVVSYKVSVNADGVTYRPATGSIAYNQMIPVGQFTIENATTRSMMSLELGEETNTFTVPLKK